MMVEIKNVLKEFNLAKKHFKKAVELGKKNVVVGQINFAGTPIKIRVRKAKVAPEGKELPDLDKDGYMKKRKKGEDDVGGI